MVNNITAGPGIYVSGNSYSSTYINMSAPSAGMLRYNGATMEVYNGTSWLTMASLFPQISLDGDTLRVLDWARGQMQRQARIQELAATSPTVADAVAAVQQAEQDLEVIMALAHRDTP